MSLAGTDLSEIVSTIIDLVRDHYSQKQIELSVEQCERIAGTIIYENFPNCLERLSDEMIDRLFKPSVVESNSVS